MKKTPLFKQSNLVEVKRNKKYKSRSRAVYARKNIKKGKTIEEVPVIRMPRDEVFPENVDKQPCATISWYCFEWHKDKKYSKNGFTAIALGYGSLYNHSDDPNAKYEHINGDCLRFVAKKNIKKGEEITINYMQGCKGEVDFPKKKPIPQ